MNGGFPRCFLCMRQFGACAWRAPSHVVIRGPGSSHPVCLSPPLPRPFRSAGGQGKRAIYVDASKGQAPALRRRHPRPAGQTQAPAVFARRGRWEMRGSRAPGGRGLGAGGPAASASVAELSRFSPGSSLPVGWGRGRRSRRRRHAKGVQPGSGALWEARAGPGLLGSRVSAVPAARTTTECFPRGPRPPRASPLSQLVTSGEVAVRGRPAAT